MDKNKFVPLTNDLPSIVAFANYLREYNATHNPIPLTDKEKAFAKKVVSRLAKADLPQNVSDRKFDEFCDK